MSCTIHRKRDFLLWIATAAVIICPISSESITKELAKPLFTSNGMAYTILVMVNDRQPPLGN